MIINVNDVTGKTKDLANALGKIMNTVPVYRRGAYRDYAVGDIIVGAGGTVTFAEGTDKRFIMQTLAALAENGYTEIKTAQTTAQSDGPGPAHVTGTGPANATGPEPLTLTVEIPLEGFTEAAIANLERLAASKTSVLKQALNAETLPIERGETTLRFPWFTLPPDEDPADYAEAYTTLITKMCDLAKRQKRVSEKETSADNPKWIMRTFLLRLGFVGDAYKTSRRILTAGLEGDGAFRQGRRPGNENGTPTDEKVTQF